MKIAILEDDKDILLKIKSQVENVFDVNYFVDTNKLIEECFNFDVVLIANKFVNKEVIDKISEYKLEIGVLNKNGKLDFDDEHISLFLDAKDIEQLGEKLKYFDAKIRINGLLDIEQKSLNKMQKLTTKVECLRTKSKTEIEQEKITTILNCSYFLEIKESVAVLEIREIISRDEITDVFSVIKNVDYKLAIYFSMNTVSSSHLGTLVSLWKQIKEKNGKLIYWNKKNDDHIVSLFELCKIDKIIEIVSSFEEVKIKLN
jgi:anti-anti-sigma regulatory factor